MITTGIGRFTRDPVLKKVGDTNVCEFSLAVDERRKIKDKNETIAHFFNFAVWDKAAELIVQYCKKGDQIYFVATPRQEKWVDKETGKNREKVMFRMNEFSFIGGRRQEGTEKKEEAADAAPF